MSSSLNDTIPEQRPAQMLNNTIPVQRHTQTLNDTIPPPRPRRPRSPDGPNDIPFTARGPYLARITRFSGPYWERQVKADPDDADPVGEGRPETRWENASRDTPGAIPRMRIQVVFEKLTGRTGEPLQLTTKYRASRDASSVFARMLAALAGLPPEAIATTNLDLADFVDRPVSVFMRNGLGGMARIESIMPAPIDAAR